jgi:hypothetical protein
MKICPICFRPEGSFVKSIPAGKRLQDELLRVRRRKDHGRRFPAQSVVRVVGVGVFVGDHLVGRPLSVVKHPEKIHDSKAIIFGDVRQFSAKRLACYMKTKRDCDYKAVY